MKMCLNERLGVSVHVFITNSIITTSNRIKKDQFPIYSVLFILIRRRENRRIKFYGEIMMMEFKLLSCKITVTV